MKRKPTEQLKQQTAEAYRNIREAISNTSEELTRRLERMREKASETEGLRARRSSSTSLKAAHQ